MRKQLLAGRIRMSNRRRLEELRAFITLCFHLIDETDLKEVSNRTHLTVRTLLRIQSADLTLRVRFGTIQALGIAAGVQLVASKDRYQMVLV